MTSLLPDAPVGPGATSTSDTSDTGETGDTGRPGFWARNRLRLGVGAALVLALVSAVWLAQEDPTYDGPLDPRNPDPEGAQAVARVLAEEGVAVTIARSADELTDAAVDDGTTVLVTSTRQLAPSTTDRLLEDAEDGRIVLVEPPRTVREQIWTDLPTSTTGPVIEADCTGPMADLTLSVDDATAYGTPQGCFADGPGYVLARDGDLVLLGAGDALTNDQVLRGDNAAVALRLLGERDRLVWYVPTYDDAEGDEAVSLWTFAPDWLGPALACVALAAVGLLGWRGRRFGPLATEPLPVTVRAVETARSRGRLYRRGNDRGHAAAALRAATRRRLGDRLRLGRRATEAGVVSAVAHRLDRHEDEIAALLATDAEVPDTDQELVRLAHQLAQLDREVRRG